jgi:predicted ribosomally synthesized peptide with nif11-like leader
MCAGGWTLAKQGGAARPSMSRSSLEAFLEAAVADAGLQEQLLVAPDAATLAAIAQAAGYPVSEADWLLASEAGREELAAAAAPEAPQVDPLLAFLHQAQGDAALQAALAEAEDAAAVAAIAQAAGYPLTTADLWAGGGADPGEIAPPAPLPDQAVEPADAARQEALDRFLRQIECDPQLQAALAEAADAAAVAMLAQAAGHPLREADLWLASGLDPQDLRDDPGFLPEPGSEPLTAFLHQAQADAALQNALAEAQDAAAVADLARAAGYLISPADLWAASGAEPEELTVEVFVLEEIGELPG